MEKNKKNTKRKFTSFTNKTQPKHFTQRSAVVSDVLGSYTGTPVNTTGHPDRDDLYPVQDADDL